MEESVKVSMTSVSPEPSITTERTEFVDATESSSRYVQRWWTFVCVYIYMLSRARVITVFVRRTITQLRVFLQRSGGASRTRAAIDCHHTVNVVPRTDGRSDLSRCRPHARLHAGTAVRFSGGGRRRTNVVFYLRPVRVWSGPTRRSWRPVFSTTLRDYNGLQWAVFSGDRGLTDLATKRKEGRGRVPGCTVAPK